MLGLAGDDSPDSWRSWSRVLPEFVQNILEICKSLFSSSLARNWVVTEWSSLQAIHMYSLWFGFVRLAGHQLLYVGKDSRDKRIGGNLFDEPSTLFTRGWLKKLTSGGLTVSKLSWVRLETVILGPDRPKYRLMLFLNPPAVGLTALEPLLMPHPCWIPNTVFTPVKLIDVCAHSNKATKQLLFFSITVVYTV